MPDVGAVEITVPLRIVIPHGVRLSVDDRRYCVGVEGQALREEDEVWLEPPRFSPNDSLSHGSPGHSFDSAVIDQQCLVSRASECALERCLHPPRIIAADEQDSHL
jgi:hypothetical protein